MRSSERQEKTRETFEAIKRFMEENKINKTGDGFSMLKALSGQKET